MTERRQIRAAIIDDEPFARADLAAVLAELSEVKVEIIGEAGSLAEARNLLCGVLPDVVFLDLDLRGGNGLDLLPHVAPTTQVVVVSAHRNLLKSLPCDRVRHRLPKPVTEEQLLDALCGSSIKFKEKAMSEKVFQFLIGIKDNEALQKQVYAEGTTPEDIQRIAQSQGVALTLDEIKEAGATLSRVLARPDEYELSDDDLQAVAGGFDPISAAQAIVTGSTNAIQSTISAVNNQVQNTVHKIANLFSGW